MSWSFSSSWGREAAATSSRYRVGDDFVLEMLREPNVARSVLSEHSRRELIMSELVPPTDEPATCPLRSLRTRDKPSRTSICP